MIQSQRTCRHPSLTLAEHSWALPFFPSLILVHRALFSLFAFAFLFRTRYGLTSTRPGLTSMMTGMAVDSLLHDNAALGDDAAPLLRCVVFRRLPLSLSLSPFHLPSAVLCRALPCSAVEDEEEHEAEEQNEELQDQERD